MISGQQPKTFVRGAAILGLAGLLVQVLGAIFRIPLANIIGEEGMGYFQTAYPVYIFILIFSTNGAPAAISKMVSEHVARGNYSEAHRVFRVSFLLMISLGVVSCGAVYFLAGPLVRYFGNPEAYYAMVAIAPALLFVPIMAVFRGYFQGFQVMGPSALSQLAEQVVRVGVGLTLAVVLLPLGIQAAAAGASAAGSIGPVFGTILIAAIYLYMKKRRRLPFNAGNRENLEPESGKSIFLRLAGIAIPVTIGVSIFPIMNLLDLMVVMRRLQETGFSMAQANNLYGQLSGYAGPVVNLPQSLALAMALSLVPSVAAAKSLGDREDLEKTVKLGLRIAMIIGVPCAFGIMAIPQQILDLIYPASIGKMEAASQCLFLLGLGVIFICVAQTMAGILQGIGKAGLAVVGIAAGAVVKYVVSWLLIGIPSLNVSGAALGTTAGLLAAAVLDVFFVRRVTGVRHDFKLAILKPLLCGVLGISLAILIVYGGGMLTDSRLLTVIAIFGAAGLYALLLIKTKTILPEELKVLPKGDLLYRLAVKSK